MTETRGSKMDTQSLAIEVLLAVMSLALYNVIFYIYMGETKQEWASFFALAGSLAFFIIVFYFYGWFKKERHPPPPPKA
jgi:amino acid permease